MLSSSHSHYTLDGTTLVTTPALTLDPHHRAISCLCFDACLLLVPWEARFVFQWELESIFTRIDQYSF